jgi:hypothetical protein
LRARRGGRRKKGLAARREGEGGGHEAIEEEKLTPACRLDRAEEVVRRIRSHGEGGGARRPPSLGEREEGLATCRRWEDARGTLLLCSTTGEDVPWWRWRMADGLAGRRRWEGGRRARRLPSLGEREEGLAARRRWEDGAGHAAPLLHHRRGWAVVAPEDGGRARRRRIPRPHRAPRSAGVGGEEGSRESGRRRVRGGMAGGGDGWAGGGKRGGESMTNSVEIWRMMDVGEKNIKERISLS